MKEKIRDFAMSLGVDDVGFAAAVDYNSLRSTPLTQIFPGVTSLVVMAIREMSHVESPNKLIAMNGRLDIMEYMRSCTYKLARFLEKNCGALAMSVPLSYPMPMNTKTMGTVADVSLRHAAVAAGLGVFGRHNLVIHPRLGTRVLYSAVLCDLALPSDPPVTDDLCNECNICVEACPGGALDQEGRTDVNKCLKHSQPFGLGRNISFWRKFASSTPEQQKAMFLSDDYWSMYQASFIGFQYFCFNCYTSCPIGE
ncbi:MAG: 4Fe-4S binding protein [Syntrophomonadales bacterium]